jgi:glucuronate isomerase
VERLESHEYTPRALFERFGVEVLCTTDAATDPLDQHHALAEEGWGDRVLPTFRPDGLFHLDANGWHEDIDKLSATSGVDVVCYRSFVEALEERRSYFKEMGAVAADHGVVSPRTHRLTAAEVESVFDRALRGVATTEDATQFVAHMLMEMARMSTEDGLVMQLHAGSFRNHDQSNYERFGPDTGADIPVRTEWTRNLRELLNDFGSDPKFTLIAFTLDEGSYSRELAPLAGHYPALLLGAPWWFFDSPNGIRRYLDTVVETAGIHNLAGFNDDTRAFASIPARHDVWRRVTCDWLAGHVVRGTLIEEDAHLMAHELAYDLAKRAYRLDSEDERNVT